MKLVLLVSANSELQGDIARLFPEQYHLIACSSLSGGRVILNDISQGLVMLDSDQPGAAQWLEKAISFKPELVYIVVGSRKDSFSSFKNKVYDCLAVPFESWQLEMILDRAWERAETPPVTAQPKVCSDNFYLTGAAEQERPWAQILSDFSRALGNQFNRDKFLELFLNAVKELVPVGKVSVLLKDSVEGCYKIAAQQGLDPEVQGKLRFHSERGLVYWLNENGRILNRAEALILKESGFSGEYLQEMTLLQAEICLPLFANGRLDGFLCLGPKVTGVRFFERELELLYSICGNIAFALKDIVIHEKHYNQKVYTESILRLMNSGVIAIDNRHSITTFNQRAGDIISADPEKFTGSDLRLLPSPLGDILYETLLAGTAYHKKEVEILNGKIPLEVSTYRMSSEAGDVLGSVMIIDDISERRKVEAEKSQAEQTAMLNRFVSQLTHEIKNPMVAIQTYSELLPEKYDDPEFREGFTKAVLRDVRRLTELVDQLIAFSSPLYYQYEAIPLHDLLDASIELLRNQLNGAAIEVHKRYCPDNPLVKADRLNITRAFYYLLRYFSEKPVNGNILLLKTAYVEKDVSTRTANILISDSATRGEADILEDLFDPLGYRPDNTISLGLPVSKKIIEDHEGRLYVVQPKGSFLKFGVSIPIFSASQN
jgi:nitrogen-specific signal transduction histidine kinase